MSNVTIQAAQEFLVGTLARLLNVNNMSTLEKCVQATNGVVTEVRDIITDVNSLSIKDIMKAVEDVSIIFQNLPDELGHCANSQEDIKRIREWATIFTQPASLISTALGNLFTNFTVVITQIFNPAQQFIINLRPQFNWQINWVFITIRN